MLNLIDIEAFIYSDNQSFRDSNSYKHQVIRGRLKNDERSWICKETDCAQLARMELVAQEFFRLIIPYQPQTRIAWHQQTGVFYILSEEVLQFKNLPKNQSYKFESGSFSGLAEVLLTSIFLQEVDIKDGNIGLDSQNRVVKIDGDWCFCSLFHQEDQCFITPELIKNLPFIDNYFVHNWFDIYTEGKKNSSRSMLLSPLINHSKGFKNGLNKAILRILCLSDSYIEAFVDGLISSCGVLYSDFIIKRRNSLRECVLELPEFVNFLKSSEAKSEIDLFCKQMKSFHLGGVVSVITDENEKRFVSAFQSNLRDLYQSEPTYNPKLLASQTSRRVINLSIQCKKILYIIQAYSIGHQDRKTDEMVGDYLALINQSEFDAQRLTELHKELELILKSVKIACKYIENFPEKSFYNSFYSHRLRVEACQKLLALHPKDRGQVALDAAKEASKFHQSDNTSSFIFFAK